MTPREFLAKYGRPVYTEVRLDGASPYRIPQNPDRYLLGFMWSTPGIAVVPDSELDGVVVPVGSLPPTAPLIFTHALHGALVNLGWQVTSGGFPAVFGLIEGVMLPPTPIRRGNGKATNDTPNRLHRRR